VLDRGAGEAADDRQVRLKLGRDAQPMEVADVGARLDDGDRADDAAGGFGDEETLALRAERRADAIGALGLVIDVAGQQAFVEQPLDLRAIGERGGADDDGVVGAGTVAGVGLR